MALSADYEPVELLPLVKAYPNLSRQYGEVSCVAALTLPALAKSEWLRLYPVPFRSLEGDRQFRKYQPIIAEVAPHTGDSRPESRRVNADSITVSGEPIGTANGWAKRRSIVEPVLDESMCSIRRMHRSTGRSLGAFRPAEVRDLLIEPVEPDPKKSELAEAWAAQSTLLGTSSREAEREALEQIPFRFKYRYRCADRSCGGHEQTIVDWEIAQHFRRARNREDWRDLIRQRWLGELCAPSRDTAFIVGDQHQHPGSFLVLDVWYPPAQPVQLGLGQMTDL